MSKSCTDFVGVGTKIDPTLCRADRLVGQVLGSVGGLPNVFMELEISFFLLRRLLGVRTDGDKKAAKVGLIVILFSVQYWNIGVISLESFYCIYSIENFRLIC